MKGQHFTLFLLQWTLGFGLQMLCMWAGFYFAYALPFIYVYALLALPFNASSSLSMGLGLAVGLGLDIAYDMLGVHAAACVGVMFLRTYVTSFYFPMMDAYDNTRRPNPYRLGWHRYVFHMGTLLLLHHGTLFLLDAGFNGIAWTLLRIVLSTLSTLSLICLWHLIAHFFRKETNKSYE